MLNRYLFSLLLKLARVSADLTDSGRLYQTVGNREGSVTKLSSCQWNNKVWAAGRTKTLTYWLLLTG